MEKTIDFNRSIKELAAEYPEVIEIMKTLGFDQITSPMMLNTAGRFMTIRKGAEMKQITLEKVKDEFVKHGFKIME